MMVIQNRIVLLLSFFLLGVAYVIFVETTHNYESLAASLYSNSSAIKLLLDSKQSHKNDSTAALLPNSSLSSASVVPSDLQPVYHPLTKSNNESSTTLLTASLNLSTALSHSVYVQPSSPIQPPTSCRRVCTNRYQNVIVLSDLNPAGWMDRVFMILAVSQLAGYLCAKVWLPRPMFLLASTHNDNKRISINMTWDEFGDFRFVNDATIPQGHDGSHFNTSIPLGNTNPYIDWLNKKDIQQLPNPKDVLDDPRFKGWFIVNTTEPDKIYRDLRLVEEFSWNITGNKDSQVGFMWHISANYYKWKRYLEQFIHDRRSPRAPPPLWLVPYVASNQSNISYDNQAISSNSTAAHLRLNYTQWQMMQPFLKTNVRLEANLSEGCEYVTLRPPYHIHDLNEKLRKFVLQETIRVTTNTSFGSNVAKSNLVAKATSDNETSFVMGYFHIRRGDAIKQCDTTLETIDHYLNCSFDSLATSLWSTEMNRKQPLVVAVLFSSDEIDLNYRQAIAQIIRRQSDRFRNDKGPQIQVIGFDGDKLITDLLEEEIQQGRAPARRRNNFYLYEAIFFLNQNRTMFQFHLEKRRSFYCPNCTNIAEQIRNSQQLS